MEDKKYIAIPGEFFSNEENRKKEVEAERVIELYGVDESDCGIWSPDLNNPFPRGPEPLTVHWKWKLNKSLYKIPSILSVEVYNLLMGVIDRRKKIYRLQKQIWEDAYCGNVPFYLDGWIFVFFNDCNELDYLDWVKCPEGRESEFKDWSYCDPVGLFDESEYKRFDEALCDSEYLELEGWKGHFRPF